MKLMVMSRVGQRDKGYGVCTVITPPSENVASENRGLRESWSPRIVASENRCLRKSWSLRIVASENRGLPKIVAPGANIIKLWSVVEATNLRLLTSGHFTTFGRQLFHGF
ncbi:uncharacterized protein ATNIH1004_003998 [Aspergillus tanneri]|uniref:Uncharacterized protein n=1 Tax=Aspergillus tanneri TaxID=1220188 RepID=A0A5M9MM78_9EURO|nr:uncharacterized protein ATNIH1004_003998 [Aspergillus tanneri]KAA8648115.1 hypothetical protein ATNIH1004_003998 [Aspergillus tanneri]